MKKTITALLPLLALAACSSGSTPFGRDVRHLPKYMTETPPRFGDWWVNTERCTIEAGTGDIFARTDGHLENNMLPVTVTFNLPLTKPPLATLSGIPVPVPMEGPTLLTTNRTYTVRLAYDATTAAHMLDHGTFLTLTYQPLTGGPVRESNLQTNGLIFAIGELNKLCQ